MSQLLTRRRYLLIKMLEAGTSIFVAHEAVASTALAHPEWDMDEEKTWAEWEQ
jgi:hypothetical protein